MTLKLDLERSLQLSCGGGNPLPSVCGTALACREYEKPSRHTVVDPQSLRVEKT